MKTNANRLVIFGLSNILSDLFECGLGNGLTLAKVVIDESEECGERDISLEARLTALKRTCVPPMVEQLDDFKPVAGELYLLGPTTPRRAVLANILKERFGLNFYTLIHQSAYVSPLANLAEGVFVGANSVIGPGAQLAEHVFVNRGVTIGHDTYIGAFSRIQPGSNLGGLSHIGCGVTVAIGATLLERLIIGDHAFIGAGAVVISDVPANVLMVGVPAKIKKSLV
jgi:sugar O-acyltransferase (sialic acid O-acetyltransferase NeuD family)